MKPSASTYLPASFLSASPLRWLGYGLVVTYLFSLSACLSLQKEEIPLAEKTIENLVVPAGFDFQVMKEKEVEITILDNEDEPLGGVPVAIFSDSASYAQDLLMVGQTDANGRWTGRFQMESWREAVVIHTPYLGLPLNRIVAFPAAESSIQLTLGGQQPTIFDEPKNEIPPSIRRVGQSDDFSSRYVYLGSYDANGVPAYLEPQRDPITQDLLDLINNTLPEGSQVPIDNPQYIPEGIAADTRLLDSASVWVTFVHEGAGYRNALGYYVYDLTNPPSATDDIDSLFILFPNASFAGSGGGMYSGDKVYLGDFSPGTGIGWFLVNNGWNSGGQVVNNVADTKWSNPAFNTFTTAANRQHVALLLDNDRQILLLGMEDIARPGGDKDFNDAVFYVTTNPFEAIDTKDVPLTKPATGNDQDEDGVIDNNDAYPNDPSKAFDSYSPGLNTFGSLAFEDLWPHTGDYDMNDVVVDYQVHFMTNVANEVAEMEIRLVVKALGGSLKNGMGIELNCDPTAITSVSGAQFNRNLLTISPNGTEAGQSKAVLIAFEDGHKYVGANSGVFVNTELGATYYEADTILLVVDFADPIPRAQLGYAPFNPFIYINQERGRELHLKNNPPTSLADLSYFGTEADASDPGANQYYQTERGMPWAIQLPTSFEYPIEQTALPKAHLRFVDWVESAGLDFPTWYLNASGNRVPALIFQR
jgi:LruC domain-containing protein